MAPRRPRDKTRRLVLARSGNQCAYPACANPIFDTKQLLGTLAHIKGSKHGSARHDTSQDPEERQGPDNLIAMCKEHGNLIDDPANVEAYTVEYLVNLKREHEEKVERDADRSWIKPPNAVTGGQFGPTTIRFWIDRHGRPRVYNDDQLAMLGELLALSSDFSSLNTTLAALQSLNAPEVQTLLQQRYAEIANEKKLVERLTLRMAIAPNVTFGEFLHFIVKGGNATAVINRGSALRVEIIEGRRPSFYFPKRKPSTGDSGE